jgi:excisionase family DNA binding protein
MNTKNIALLTLKEASELLGCHPNTLRKWDANGLLQAVRFGVRGDRRYRSEDILKLIGKSSYVENQKEVFQVSAVRKEYFKEYASLLVKWGNLTKDSVFVDVPCGTGEMTKTLASNGFGKKFYLIDINLEMIEAVNENLPENAIVKLGDAGDICTLIPEKVDAIFCLNGFHIYIERKQEFLKGCYRILKPGGVLIFDVSTKGMYDKPSKDFFNIQTEELKHLAEKFESIYKPPLLPDETIVDNYRNEVIKEGFVVNQTVSIDKWIPVDEVIGATLKIPGRLRPWLPGISDAQRIKIYKKSNEIAKKKTGITIIKHNRIFFIAEKEL